MHTHVYVCMHYVTPKGCDIYMNCCIHKDTGVISADSQDVGQF